MAASFPVRFMFDQITGGMVVAGGLALTTAFYAYTRRGPPKLCEMCGGNGGWTCVICDGEGTLRSSSSMRVKKQCVACVGRGKRICRRCDGTGYDKKTMFIG